MALQWREIVELMEAKGVKAHYWIDEMHLTIHDGRLDVAIYPEEPTRGAPSVAVYGLKEIVR